MQLTADYFDFARSQGELLLARVMTRDHLHLSPPTLTRAAAARARAGIRAVEAWLRRVILLLALTLEQDLIANNHSYQPHPAAPRFGRGFQFRIFTGERDWPGLTIYAEPKGPPRRGVQVPAAPLLEKLRALQTLMEAPDTRARQLAFLIARRRPGPLLAPDLWRCLVRARDGTERSAFYTAMGHAIARLSRSRPPPLGPVPRPLPRVRRL
ncbi:MAG: hypothetical protein AAF768_10215 [Pseudomonadota bacterium]